MRHQQPLRDRQSHTNRTSQKAVRPRPPVPQRVTPGAACTCGGGCPRCAAAIQAKSFTPGDDPYEREAEAVAAQVVSAPAGAANFTPRANTGGRVAQAKGMTASAPPPGEAVAPAAAGGGEPLAESTRMFMEPRFGANFGDVHVHTDADAAAMNDRLQARAFTYGADIWLGAGESMHDKKLMAHELTHTLQQRGAAARIQRAPRVANMDWTVDHSDVATGTETDLLTDAMAGLTGEPPAGAAAYVGVVAKRKTWKGRAALYIRAIDFLRDNRGLFAVPDYWDTIARALDYCDISSASATSLSDAFYEQLLIRTVYKPGALTASFKHSSGTVYNVPGRIAGTVEFAPSMRDSLLRPAPKTTRTLTGGFPTGTDLLAGFGAQPGARASRDAAALTKRYSSRIPSTLQPFLKTLATDGTIYVVLERFLKNDKGSLRIEPVGLGGAHYTDSKPPSIEVDARLFPGSGSPDELTDIGLRATLAHELYHYALDRADTAFSEVGDDHELISLIEDRYLIIATILAGQSPVSDEIEALNGWVGGDPKPSLNGYIAADDKAGLESYAGNQDFLDSMVYTMLVGPISSNEVTMKSGKLADFLFDPAQINDLAYFAAVNGVILRKALEIGAKVARKTGTPLNSVWTHADYLKEIKTFISSFMSLVGSNRTAGAAALAATI